MIDRYLHNILFKATLLFVLSWPSWILADIVMVGPGKEFVMPSIAAEFVNDGDIVEIDANGSYAGDVAVWKKNNLIIRGVGGRAHIRGTGVHAEGKGLWVIKGDNTIVENMEFSGARVPDKNGAGIRHEGTNLIIRNSYFHDNENGILTGENKNSVVNVEYSEFSRNGYGDGQTHNIYIGNIRRFTLRFSYIHHAFVGHNVKSRALENHILYNRIMDEQNGTSSYLVDIPIGGKSYLVGNVFQQGVETNNWAMVAYAAEGASHKQNTLWVVNNTFVNDRSSGIFIKVWGGFPVRAMNNIFAGRGTKLKGGKGRMSNNIGPILSPKFVDRLSYNYHLTKTSKAINAGVEVIGLEFLESEFNFAPLLEYAHVAGRKERNIVGRFVDIGAFEYGVVSP